VDHSIRDPKNEEEVTQLLRDAADRLNPIIGDGNPHPRARYARYSLLAWAGDTAAALAEAKAVLASGVTDPAALAATGFFQAQQDDLAAAEASLVAATAADPSDSHAAYILGLVRWQATSDPVPSLPLIQRLDDETPIDLSARDIAF